jgi:branched-subunit amino acid transport protein AzlD
MIASYEANNEKMMDNLTEKEDLLKVCGRYMAQDVFALLVPSCCEKSGTSWYHLVTRLMTVIDLLQVVTARLILAVRNTLLRTC